MNVVIEKQKSGTYIAYNVDCDGVSLMGTGVTAMRLKMIFSTPFRK